MASSKEFMAFLKRFVDGWEGKKIGLVMAGGGASAASLALIPGSSRVLYDMTILYAEDATKEFLHTYHDCLSKSAVIPEKFVSKEMVLALQRAAVEKTGPACYPVIATSALTSGRPRKGDNVAYICGRGDVWKLILDKLPEEVYSDSVTPWREQRIAIKRQSEDELVAEVAIKLVTGFEVDSLEGRISNGTLVRL